MEKKKSNQWGKSAGAVILSCSVKFFLKIYAKSTGKYLRCSLFLKKFQSLKPATLLKCEFKEGVFL